jgi:hypothetical protein
MVEAMAAAQEVADQPLTSTERSIGWTDEIMDAVRDWLANCQADLRISPHPTRRMEVSWVRGWDGTFDPRVEDARQTAILRASNAISRVRDFEELLAQITEFERLLNQRDPDHYDLDLSDEAVSGLEERIEALRDLLEADRPMTKEEIEAWKVSLTPYGAKWTNGVGKQPWRSGDGSRFWGYQPEIVWQALSLIVDSVDMDFIVDSVDMDWEPGL